MHTYTLTVFPRDAGRAIRRFAVDSELSACQFTALVKVILAGLSGIVSGPVLIERYGDTGGQDHPGFTYLIQ